MKNSKKRMEQRRQRRFPVKDGAYTVLECKPFKTGKIINISRDGLAVRYFGNGEPLKEIFELDIFILNSNFYIEKVRVNTISDIQMADKPSFSFDIIRQRCFQFGKMTSGQLFYLDYFIENFTQKKVSKKTGTEQRIDGFAKTSRRY